MGAIIAIITFLVDNAPRLIAAGADVYSMVQQARAAVDQIGTQVSPDDEAFRELDAKVANLESAFQIAVKKRLEEEPPPDSA